MSGAGGSGVGGAGGGLGLGGGGAPGGLGLDCPAGATCGLAAEYFRMPSYEGRAFDAANLALTRIDPQVSFDWGNASPDPALPAAGFLARWTGFLRLPLRTPASDTYHFSVRADDGVRLWVDERLVVDDWTDHTEKESGGDLTLTAGARVPIKLEYYQHTGTASVSLAWSWAEQPSVPIPSGVLGPPTEVNGLAAIYYTGEAFDAVAVSRRDLEVGFRWALDSPDPAVPGDHFSARWTGTIEPRYSETYTFSLAVAEANEGVRLIVNGTRVVDAFTPPLTLENSGAIALQAGQRYPITVEYFEGIGAAAIELFWASASQPRARVSWHRLRPLP